MEALKARCEHSKNLCRTCAYGSCRFEGVSDVYKFVADDSELGKEKPGARVRGKTVEDVVELLSQAMESKESKLNSGG